jgi:hypothetical protein
VLVELQTYGPVPYVLTTIGWSVYLEGRNSKSLQNVGNSLHLHDATINIQDLQFIKLPLIISSE